VIEGAAVAFSLAAHERMNSNWHGEPDRILEDHHGCGGMGGGYCIDPADWVGRDGCPVQGSESHTVLQKRGGAGAGAGGGTVRQSSMMR
jgi:hypothetical protein